MFNSISIHVTLGLAVATTPAFAQCRFPDNDRTGRVLSYTFDPIVTSASTTLHIELGFHGGPGAEEEIEVPSEWADETLDGVINIRALTADSVVVDTSSPGRKILRHAPDQDVGPRLGCGEGLDRAFQPSSAVPRRHVARIYRSDWRQRVP